MAETKSLWPEDMEDSFEFIRLFGSLQQKAHETAKEKGWWDTDRTLPHCMGMVMTEMAEVIEAARKGYQYPDGTFVVPQSGKIPVHNVLEEEMADVFIRLMDTAQRFRLNVAGAIWDKMEYNKTRPHRHGGKNY
jgi:NTP pyrophosphatase (non-canonical NTP hydrolase)